MVDLLLEKECWGVEIGVRVSEVEGLNMMYQLWKIGVDFVKNYLVLIFF